MDNTLCQAEESGPPEPFSFTKCSLSFSKKCGILDTNLREGEGENMKCKQWIIKYREILLYLIFGVATTLVNLVLFACMNFLLGEQQYLVSNVVATVLAILFAYVTNKLFVFESKSWEWQVLKKEIPSFFGARAFTFFLEEAGLWLLIDCLGMGSLQISLFSFVLTGTMLVKLVLQIVVIVLNYIFSKFLIFAKKRKNL